MQPPPLALTMGEPGGVGPDLTLAVWLERERLGVPAVLLPRRPGLHRRTGAHCSGSTARSRSVDAARCRRRVRPRAAGRSAPGRGRRREPGRADPANAAAVVEAIARAVGDVRSGAAGGDRHQSDQQAVALRRRLPPSRPHRVSRHAVGGVDRRRRRRPVMMLAGPELRAVPVTIHIPLRDVADTLSEEMIVETGRIVADDLRRRFALPDPRLAVAGLNPHAGEGGALGTRGPDRHRPGGRGAARARASTSSGPLSADAMFHPAARGRLRRRALHVSRPGADPGEDAGLLRDGQRHPRPRLRPHLARPRHRLRPRRHRQGRSVEPRGRPPPRGRAGGATNARHERDRRSAAAPRRHRPPRPLGRQGASARTSSSTSTSPRGSPAPPATSTASTVIEVGPGPGGLTRALLAAGARQGGRGRTRRALPCRARRDRRTLSRAGSTVVHGDALEVDFAGLADGPDADRRQPPLQHRDAAAGRLAPGRAVAAVLRVDDADVPARGRGTHRRRRRARRPMGASAFSPAGGARRASCSTFPPTAFTPPPKVMSSVVGLVPEAAAPPRRCGRARAGRRRGLRPAPQDAPPEPEVARRRSAAACSTRRASSRRGGPRRSTSPASSRSPRAGLSR